MAKGIKLFHGNILSLISMKNPLEMSFGKKKHYFLLMNLDVDRPRKFTDMF